MEAQPRSLTPPARNPATAEAVAAEELTPLSVAVSEALPPTTTKVSFSPETDAGSRTQSQQPPSRKRRITLNRTESQKRFLEADPDVQAALESGIKEAFKIFADGSGMLTEHAAASLLRFLDKTPPQAMIDNEARIAAGIDLGRTSTKGTLDLEAFTTMLLASIKSSDWEMAVPDAFEQLDKNRNNRVKARDLKRALLATFKLEATGIKFSKSDADDMVRQVDGSGKGYVDWEDFQRVLHAIENQRTEESRPAPKVPLPKYLRDARSELERAEESRPALLKCCARIGCATAHARSIDLDFKHSEQHPEEFGDLEAAKNNKYWKIVHIYTVAGLLGRVRGQGEFWHGHEAADHHILDEDDTPPFSETWVITPGRRLSFTRILFAIPFYTENAIILPRQARDKHRERALKKRSGVSAGNSYAVVWDCAMIMLLLFVTVTVKQTRLLRYHFILKIIFYLDRLGTNIGKALKTRRVFLRNRSESVSASRSVKRIYLLRCHFIH